MLTPGDPRLRKTLPGVRGAVHEESIVRVLLEDLPRRPALMMHGESRRIARGPCRWRSLDLREVAASKRRGAQKSQETSNWQRNHYRRSSMWRRVPSSWCATKNGW